MLSTPAVILRLFQLPIKELKIKTAVNLVNRVSTEIKATYIINGEPFTTKHNIYN